MDLQTQHWQSEQWLSITAAVKPGKQVQFELASEVQPVQVQLYWEIDWNLIPVISSFMLSQILKLLQILKKAEVTNLKPFSGTCAGSHTRNGALTQHMPVI